MHGDVISLAKKPDLLACGTRRVARLAEEKALTAVCVDAVVSDTRVALEAAAAACEVLANRVGEGPLTPPSSLSSLSSSSSSPQKGLLKQKAKNGSSSKDAHKGEGEKEKEASSSASSEGSIPGLPPHLQEQQARVLKRLEVVRADQQAWTNEAEAGLKQLCDAESGGDLDAILAAEESLLVGPDAGGKQGRRRCLPSVSLLLPFASFCLASSSIPCHCLHHFPDSRVFKFVFVLLSYRHGAARRRDEFTGPHGLTRAGAHPSPTPDPRA